MCVLDLFHNQGIFIYGFCEAHCLSNVLVFSFLSIVQGFIKLKRIRAAGCESDVYILSVPNFWDHNV